MRATVSLCRKERSDHAEKSRTRRVRLFDTLHVVRRHYTYKHHLLRFIVRYGDWEIEATKAEAGKQCRKKAAVVPVDVELSG